MLLLLLLLLLRMWLWFKQMLWPWLWLRQLPWWRGHQHEGCHLYLRCLKRLCAWLLLGLLLLLLLRCQLGILMLASRCCRRSRGRCAVIGVAPLLQSVALRPRRPQSTAFAIALVPALPTTGFCCNSDEVITGAATAVTRLPLLMLLHRSACGLRLRLHHRNS
jgi:hypothetical protein